MRLRVCDLVRKARRLVADVLAPRARLRVTDLLPPSVDRRRVCEVMQAAPPAARRRVCEVMQAAPPAARRRVCDLSEYVIRVRRRVADLAPVVRNDFAPPDFYKTVYYTWAARYFHQNIWKVSAHEDVDDLLQLAYLKYRRCIELYIYEQQSCRGAAHFMQLFKRACSNLVTDRARKKSRTIATDSIFEFDSIPGVDHTLLTIEGLV